MGQNRSVGKAIKLTVEDGLTAEVVICHEWMHLIPNLYIIARKARKANCASSIEHYSVASADHGKVQQWL